MSKWVGAMAQGRVIEDLVRERNGPEVKWLDELLVACALRAFGWNGCDPGRVGSGWEQAEARPMER